MKKRKCASVWLTGLDATTLRWHVNDALERGKKKITFSFSAQSNWPSFVKHGYCVELVNCAVTAKMNGAYIVLRNLPKEIRDTLKVAGYDKLFVQH